MSRILLVLLIAFVGCNKTPKKEINFVPNPIKEVVCSGLKHPWSIAFINENDVLVAEKDGDLLRIDLQSKTKQVIKGFPKDLTDSIRVQMRGDNSGIFDVVLDPDFTSNRNIYFSYAAKRDTATTTKVVSARLENDSLTNIKVLIEAKPYTREYFHYGGGLCFGKDGMLYATIGERLFREIDEPALPIAQDITDRRGKIYRIHKDGSIPKDNPDFGKNGVPGLYGIGIRAAQGITMHPKTGQIWFSEHGTKQGDEINILKSGGNYGWPIITTGGYRSDSYKPPKLEGVAFTNPVWWWPHTVAPTGLTFYTGDEFPAWKNSLFVSGLSRGSLWRFTVDGEIVKSAEELFLDSRIRSRKVAQSPEGKLYILTDEPDGKILRIKNQNHE
ncbi:PQQ-dependent sugar dehydrogenase [Spongiivirga sp. MCCC 1A20706]|uniref:PQQ-dependent sugar dehydrogenase n=1 Tax=Spongiivirga sp. MCCC 1A20706 TaxID=3160963 RepID=UPI0039778835